MTNKALTDVSIRKYAAGVQRWRIRDAGMRSLFLVIETSGHKAFQMRFRRPNGKPARLTLGPYALANEIKGEPEIGMPLTLAGARSLAADIHRQRAQGVDVIEERTKEKLRKRIAITTRNITGFAKCVRSYIDEHARRKIRRWQWAARQLGLHYGDAGETPEIIKGGLCDRWADKAVTSIDAATIADVLTEAKRIGVPGIGVHNKEKSEARARHFADALSPFFSWLQSENLITSNPFRDIMRPKNGTSRERVLTDDEIRWFLQAADREPKPFATVLKLLLLTGQRLDEVSGMRHDELSADRSTWSLPGARTKNKRPHVVPLPKMARDLIEKMSQPEISFIFTTTGTSPVSGWSRMKHRLDKRMLEIAHEEFAQNEPHGTISKPVIAPWRLHDLRRTAATGMAEIGVAPHIVEALLNHISGAKAGVAGIYNRAVYAPEKKAALERWSAHLDRLITGSTGKVVKLQRR